MILIRTTIKKHLTDLDKDGLKKEIEKIVDKEAQLLTYRKYANAGSLKMRKSYMFLDKGTEVPIMEIRTIWTNINAWKNFMEETKTEWRKVIDHGFYVDFSVDELDDKRSMKWLNERNLKYPSRWLTPGRTTFDSSRPYRNKLGD